jgi:hypothetical protein
MSIPVISCEGNQWEYSDLKGVHSHLVAQAKRPKLFKDYPESST